MQEAPFSATDVASADDAGIDARLHGRATRIVAGTLTGVAAASLPALLVALCVVPMMPADLLRLVVGCAVAPALVARAVSWLAATRVHRRGGELVVVRRDVTIAIPCPAIARVVPWRIPLPGPGVSLVLGSGRRLPYGLELRDPTRLLRLLADECDVAGAATALSDPSVVYAHVRARAAPPRWYHLAGRFPGFALLPTALLFNVHQHIAYGALLGEYYLLGLRAWLTTLAVYWGTLTLELVLYASFWRALVEAASFAAARVAPSRAARVRRAAETTARVLYYGGVPVMLAIKFWP